MTLIDLFVKILEQQGIVALLLFIMMQQNTKMQQKLLEKNCDLNKFIMRCLERELEEDHPHTQPSQPCPEGSRFDDLTPGGIIMPFEEKVS
jgi:hypothetical protein